MYICDFVKSWAKVLHDMRAQRLDVLHPDELEHLEDGGVEEVVSVVVGDEGVNHGNEEVSLDDVTIVELVLEVDDLPHEPHRAQLQERVSRLYQNQYSPQQICKRIHLSYVVRR